LTNNAFRLGAAAAGLSLAWAPSAHAVAPVVSDIPDIVISDVEDNIGGTDNNFFVFTDAFAFDSYVSDADTAVNTLKWSFDEGTDVTGDSSTVYFNINGLGPNAVGDAAIAAAAGNPASRLNPANDIRSASSNASLRNVALTPGSGPLTSPFAPNPALFARHAEGKVVRFYVSDQTFVVSTDVIVQTIDSDTTPSQDALSSSFSVLKTDAFASDAGWVRTADQTDAQLTSFNLGSRAFDPVNTALTMTVIANSTRTRQFGWLESDATDVPYSAIGANNIARAKFSVFYSGAADRSNNTDAARFPNFRLGLRGRGGVPISLLEVNGNPTIVAALPVTRELTPSKNPAQPSIYRVDLDPVDVPYLANSTTEGLQRSIEILTGAAFANAVGTIALTDSSVGSYPANVYNVAPSKVFATGGTDFNNSGVVVERISATRDLLVRYIAGSPNANEFFLDSLLVQPNLTLNDTAIGVTTNASGITINTTGVAATRAGLAQVDLLTGNGSDTAATRLRVEAGKSYFATFRVAHAGQSNLTPSIRFRMNSVRFGYAVTYQMAGARASGDPDFQTYAAQVLPGVGSLNPNSSIDGFSYNMIYHSPLDADVRADVAGSIAAKFPNLAAEIGPGDSSNTESARNLNFGVTVLDGFSFGPNSDQEVANGMVFNRIEVRTIDRVQD
jgi:hypothetical protein